MHNLANPTSPALLCPGRAAGTGTRPRHLSMLLGGAPCPAAASSVAAVAVALEVDECGNIARLRAAAGVEGLSDRPGVPLGLVVRDRDLNGTAAEEARLVREELVHGAAHSSAERVAGSIEVQRVVPAAARLRVACEEERGGAEAVVKLRTVTRSAEGSEAPERSNCVR